MDFQNQLMSWGYLSEIMTSGIPWWWNTVSINSWAYLSAVVYLVQGAKCTILDSLSTEIEIAVYPEDTGRSIHKSVVIRSHRLEGIGRACNALGVFWWSLFVVWHIGHFGNVRCRSPSSSKRFAYWQVLWYNGYTHAQRQEHHDKTELLPVATRWWPSTSQNHLKNPYGPIIHEH